MGTLRTRPASDERSRLGPDDFSAFYTANVDRIQRLCEESLVGGSPEDLTSDVFARAWARRDQFSDIRGTPEAWLEAIARNMLTDQQRHFAAARPATARLPLPREQCVDADLEAVHDADQVRRAFQGLSEDHRAVLDRAMQTEATGVPLNVLLGCSPGSAKRQLDAASAAWRLAIQDPNPI